MSPHINVPMGHCSQPAARAGVEAGEAREEPQCRGRVHRHEVFVPEDKELLAPVRGGVARKVRGRFVERERRQRRTRGGALA